jgi:hypothetical protein
MEITTKHGLKRKIDDAESRIRSIDDEIKNLTNRLNSLQNEKSNLKLDVEKLKDCSIPVILEGYALGILHIDRHRKRIRKTSRRHSDSEDSEDIQVYKQGTEPALFAKDLIFFKDLENATKLKFEKEKYCQCTIGTFIIQKFQYNSSGSLSIKWSDNCLDKSSYDYFKFTLPEEESFEFLLIGFQLDIDNENSFDYMKDKSQICPSTIFFTMVFKDENECKKCLIELKTIINEKKMYNIHYVVKKDTIFNTSNAIYPKTSAEDARSCLLDRIKMIKRN